jgi:hypothetical protein
MKKLNVLPCASTGDDEGAMSARANPRTKIRFIVFPFFTVWGPGAEDSRFA